MTRFIITCNAGSSSIKLGKYNVETLEHTKLQLPTVDEVLSWYKKQENISAVGHRVVHGGSQFFLPVVINEQAIKQMSQLETLAPLHQHIELSIISSITALNPSIPQIACFDTAFHKDVPELEKLFPLPYSYYKDGVYRYGFHGLSYEYIASILPNIAGKKAKGRVLVAHLGSGSSICGMVNLKSKAISMGFSALDGLMMGSRSGNIDPGVLIYLLKQKRFTIEQLEDFLYHKCGLKGVSNISNDVKILEENKSEDANRALSLYCYIAAKHMGSIATAIGGIDCIVFTGGIGENSSYIRSGICSHLNWLGMAIDNNANNTNAYKISTEGCNIQVYVIPTDEEIIIARSCLGLL